MLIELQSILLHLDGYGDNDGILIKDYLNNYMEEFQKSTFIFIKLLILYSCLSKTFSIRKSFSTLSLIPNSHTFLFYYMINKYLLTEK